MFNVFMEVTGVPGEDGHLYSSATAKGAWLEPDAESSVPTTVIDAALATQLSGKYEEAVEIGDTPVDGLSEIDRLVLLATLGAGGEAIAAVQHHPDVFACPDDPAGATILTVLEETAGQFATVVPSAVDGQEVTFDTADIAGWASAAWPQVKGWLNIGRVDFPPAPSHPTTIADGARVAILGDWGTNLYGAPICASSIESDPHLPQVLIHLGDVYYTGTEKQIRQRFLNPWPKVQGAVSRACNSNHEMLSGGKPYRDTTLPAFGQSSSMWWLQNSTWSLIGLDTGWDDGTVGDLQVTWLEGVLRQARHTGRRTMAFSHHMPWRTSEPALQRKLLDPIEHLLEDRLIDAWYFGHEHLCALFERHPKWQVFGGCIGHSGYPYWAVDNTAREKRRDNPDGSSWWRHAGTTEVPASYLLCGENKFIPGHEHEYGPNGYAMLDLGSGEWTETVHEPGGIEISRRTLRPTESGAGGSDDIQ